MDDYTYSLTEATEVLSATPGTLRSMLGNLSDGWLMTRPSEEQWSPFNVVAHLIHGEGVVWIPRAQVILDQGEDRKFPPFDREGHAGRVDGKSIGDLLDEFEQARSGSINTLRSWNLTDEQLVLTGVHPEFGEVKLRQLLSTWVVHDLTHIRQIVIAMAKRYKVAVGPWTEYLSILK